MPDDFTRQRESSCLETVKATTVLLKWGSCDLQWGCEAISGMLQDSDSLHTFVCFLVEVTVNKKRTVEYDEVLAPNKKRTSYSDSKS